jgi:hypothetical protein
MVHGANQGLVCVTQQHLLVLQSKHWLDTKKEITFKSFPALTMRADSKAIRALGKSLETNLMKPMLARVTETFKVIPFPIIFEPP